MSFFSRLFGRKARLDPNAWPNDATWSARQDNVTVETADGPRHVWTVACGELVLPSGRLAVCDPFVCLTPSGTPFVQTPPGRFPVFVTIADVSEKQDRSHLREAYVSLVFAPGVEARRKTLALATEGEDRPETIGDEFVGFPVDSGTACFVDERAIGPGMPDPATWLETVFDNERPDCWFRRMDDATHIRTGIANVPLPLARNGENLILVHSGWGDGHYPVVGSFDAAGRLLAAHIDFFVISSLSAGGDGE